MEGTFGHEAVDVMKFWSGLRESVAHRVDEKRNDYDKKSPGSHRSSRKGLGAILDITAFMITEACADVDGDLVCDQHRDRDSAGRDRRDRAIRQTRGPARSSARSAVGVAELQVRS